MKRFIVTLTLAGALLVVLPAAAQAGGSLGAPQAVVQFPSTAFGSFLESIAMDSHGNLFGSLTTWGADSNIGTICRISPSGPKSIATMDLGPSGMLLGLAVDQQDTLYVALYQSAGSGSAIFRIQPNGTMVKVVALPADSWPNGLAFHDGWLYITDSALAAIWRVHLGCGVASPTVPWLSDPLLAPGDPNTQAVAGIGANGIAFCGNQLYASVSDFGRIVRVPVRPNGSPGTLQTVCQRPELQTADGIAFDALGDLWIATNARHHGSGPQRWSLLSLAVRQVDSGCRRSRLAQLPNDAGLRHDAGHAAHAVHLQRRLLQRLRRWHASQHRGAHGRRVRSAVMVTVSAVEHACRASRRTNEGGIMELCDCLRFASEHPVCYLASEDGDQARVRPLLLWFADDSGFYFMTMSPKRLSEQLHRNPKVEICFFNGAGELPDAEAMRVTGAVEFMDDAELTRKVAEERSALEGIIGRPLEPITEVFRLTHGEASFWTLADVLRERELPRVVF